ncbi:hypothetical protein BHE90_017545 [Fusarium euwallaceae]|uniref:Uncharacterized protein n=1 Tax=Fusarium euwallaceae TaxID=1147111 RepID=A0A430KX76_9HYPO|nr:hypothetical protein BHE90_017545 [Fusarium euwallaceae]
MDREVPQLRRRRARRNKWRGTGPRWGQSIFDRGTSLRALVFYVVYELGPGETFEDFLSLMDLLLGVDTYAFQAGADRKDDRILAEMLVATMNRRRIGFIFNSQYCQWRGKFIVAVSPGPKQSCKDFVKYWRREMKIEHSCGNAFSSQDVRDMVSTYLASAAERQAKRRSLLKTEVEPESDWDSDSDVDDAGAQEGLIQEQLLRQCAAEACDAIV